MNLDFHYYASYPAAVQRDAVPQALQDKIRDVFQERRLDQSDGWRSLIAATHGEAPEQYRMPCFKTDSVSYRNFCSAAVYHRDFMRRALT